MANQLSPIMANLVAAPPVKNEMQYSGGRARRKVAKLPGVGTTGIGDLWVLARFHLSDTIFTAFLTNTAFGAGTLGDLGAYLPLASATAIPVLSPISGGTSAKDRFASDIDMATVRALNTPLDIWGESGLPTTHVPLFEALGYTSLEAAQVDNPSGVVDLILELAVGAGTTEVAEIVFGYNAGD